MMAQQEQRGGTSGRIGSLESASGAARGVQGQQQLDGLVQTL